MKKIILFFLLAVLSFSCTDEEAETERSNQLSALIAGEAWTSSATLTKRERGENGPLIIMGEGGGYALELTLGGITEPGEYPLGIANNATVRIGNNIYNTLDMEDAGKIMITRYDQNHVEGTFEFDAQWLSSSNLLEIREGSFRVFYY